MKYYSSSYFNVATPIGLLTVKSNMGKKGVFHYVLFTPSTDITLFFLNHKRRQCNKYHDVVPKFIGVGRFRILGGPRFRILGGGQGGAKFPAGT